MRLKEIALITISFGSENFIFEIAESKFFLTKFLKQNAAYTLFFCRPRMTLLKEFQMPEMLRMRIEEVILKIKLLQLGNISEFLAKVLDPPDEKVVQFSIEFLQR